MKKEAGIIIGNAIVWGTVIIACSMALRGTGQFQEIQHILGGGAAVSLSVVSLVILKPKAKP